MDLTVVTVSQGFADHERQLVASMYWEAFGAKLGRVMGPENRGVAFIRDVLDPSHCLCARTNDGTLLGVVGFKTYESALVDGTWQDMARHFGWVGSEAQTFVIFVFRSSNRVWAKNSTPYPAKAATQSERGNTQRNGEWSWFKPGKP